MVVAILNERIYIVEDTIAGVGAILIIGIEQGAVMYRCLKNTLRTVGYST